mgnify:CR=1 FL=1
MAKRLTDRQRKKIIADYIELGSFNAVAKLHGVSRQTVKTICDSDQQTGQKLQCKKEQNTADLLEHMEQKRDKVCSIMDKYLDALLDEEKIAKATPAQLTTALGTLIDKFTMSTNKAEQMAEDPLTKALKEEAERMEENADQ